MLLYQYYEAQKRESEVKAEMVPDHSNIEALEKEDRSTQFLLNWLPSESQMDNLELPIVGQHASAITYFQLEPDKRGALVCP